MQTDEKLRNETGRLLDDTFQGVLATRPPNQLKPHPAYLEVCGQPSELKLSGISRRVPVLHEPLLVTSDGVILDGHARWIVAVRQGQEAVPCMQYVLTEQEALRFLLDTHDGKDGLTPYCRTLLALRLEPHLQEMARSRRKNQTMISPNLTKTEGFDVRKELARIASVSTGNVSKVREIVEYCVPEIQQSLRRGTIKIHRAWQWTELSPEKQREALWKHTNDKDIKPFIRQLIRQHKNEEPNPPTIATLARLMSQFPAGPSGDHAVMIADVPGYAVVVSRKLYKDLLEMNSK